jgi:hypothetical protein
VAKKIFTIGLSVKEIKKLKKDLINYRDNELPRKLEEFCRRLSYKGVEIAKSKVVSMNAQFTGELLASIRSQYEGKIGDTVVFCIVTDSEHAAFVEFGTGQMGQEHPYVGTLPSIWKYNSGGHIQQATEDIYVSGYSSPYIQAGDYFWVYVGEQDGKLHISKGMPSRPFMYETAIDLYSIAIATAREVFG